MKNNLIKTFLYNNWAFTFIDYLLLYLSICKCRFQGQSVMTIVDPINTTGTYTLYSPVFPNPFICAREMVGQFSYEVLNR